MTLEQAVEILNANNHLGWDTWFAMGGEAFGDGDCYSEAEAIAIAEEYERAGTTPAPRRTYTLPRRSHRDHKLKSPWK